MSWSSPSARSACCNPSWFDRLGGARFELVMGERRWRAAQQAEVDDDPGDRTRNRRSRTAPRRPAGEPASRSAEPARRGRRLPADAGRLRLHPGGARQPDQALTTADLQHHPSPSAAADCAAARCRRGDQRRAREGAAGHRGSGQPGAPRPASRGRGAVGAGGGGTRHAWARLRIGPLGDSVSRSWSHPKSRTSLIGFQTTLRLGFGSLWEGPRAGSSSSSPRSTTWSASLR